MVKRIPASTSTAASEFTPKVGKSAPAAILVEFRPCYPDGDVPTCRQGCIFVEADSQRNRLARTLTGLATGLLMLAACASSKARARISSIRHRLTANITAAPQDFHRDLRRHYSVANQERSA